MSSAALGKVRTPRPKWTALISGMASYIDAAVIVSTGIAVVIYKDLLGLTDSQVGAMSSLLTFMIAIGALVGGYTGDRFGRRRVFVVTMALIVAGALLLMFAQQYESLLVGLILVGLGSGADLPVSIATISETAKSTNRAGMVSFSQLLWKIGIIASQGVGGLFGDAGALGIAVLYGHIAVISMLVLLGRLTIPESERWQQAKAASASASASVAAPSALKQLLKMPYLASFLVLILFYGLINIGNNTTGQFGAYMFVEVAGASISTYSTIGMITTAIGFAVTFVLIKVVDGPHRSRWFLFGVACATVAFLLPAVFGPTPVTLTVMLLLQAIAVVFAGEAIMKVWSQESFPTLLRSTAQGAIIAVARVTAAVAALVTPVLLQTDPRVLFVFVLAVILVGSLSAYFYFRHRTVTEFDREQAEESAVQEPSERTAR